MNLRSTLACLRLPACLPACCLACSSRSPTLAPCCCRDAAFPLFDLPAKAVELVHGFVTRREDRRALRLTCKESRALVDRDIVAVKKRYLGFSVEEEYGPLMFADDEDIELNTIRAEDMDALVKAPWLLLRLELAYSLGPGMAARLAEADWPTLQELHLTHSTLCGGFREADIAALAAANFRDLRKLTLANNGLTAVGAAAALAAADWPRLESLDLTEFKLNGAGMAALAKGRWPCLKTLKLARNWGGDKGVAALAKGSFPCLESLVLSECYMGRRGIAALASASWARQLQSLDLSHNTTSGNIAEAAEKPLLAPLAACSWPCLQRLVLSWTGVGVASAAALAAADFPALQSLDLSNTGLRDGAMAALAAGKWSCLETLDLGSNKLGSTGAAALAAAAWPRLQKISLLFNKIGDAGAAALAASRWPALRELDLLRSELGTGAGAALAAADWPALLALDLRCNNLGAEGTRALAGARWPCLQVLKVVDESMPRDVRLALKARWPGLKLYINRLTKSGRDGVPV